MLLSIIALLSDPNPSDPINLEAARLLRNDPDTYNRMVRSMVARQRDFLPDERALVGGGRVSGVRRVGGARRVPRVRRVPQGSASRVVDNRAGEMENQGEDVAEGADRHGRGAGADDEGEGEAADDGVVGEAVDDGANNEEGDLDGQGTAGGRVGQVRDEEEGEDLAQKGDGQEDLAQEGTGEVDSLQEGDGVDDLAQEGEAGEEEGEGFAQGEN